MSKEKFISAARLYWPLPATALILLTGFVFSRGEANGAAAPEQTTTGQTAEAAPKYLPFQRFEGDFIPTTPRQGTSAQEKANTTIAEYQQKLDSGASREEEIAMMTAMGNLYRTKLGDVKRASECYSWLVTHYPDDPATRPAFIHLTTCYAQLNDGENLTRHLTAMMNSFHEDTQEHQFAKKELNMK